jgi:TolB-like protein/Flp pilus assembly protein TadD
MGINLGDIIIEPDGDIYGDGVNVAARLEQLAEPGGVCISGSVHEHAEGKVGVRFESRGEQQVKNIDRPVRVYALAGAAQKVSEPKPLALPDKPSIAVLPFTNMSSDPEQEYFADGVVEDIITALSRVKWFFVIARNSSFAYKGRAVDVKQVGRELGVRYVLEGSIRKAASRVRITGQLVDAETGHHVWADRYDGGLADIFDLQDEITQKVVAAIEPHVFAAERSRSDRKPPKSLRAWDHVMRAMPCVWAWAETDSEVALQELQRAIHIDPHYGHAHSLLAWTYMARTHMGWSQLAEALEPAKDAARTAMNQDADDPWAHLAVGYLHMVTRRYREAIAALQESVRRNPSFALGHAVLGCAYACAGGGDKGLEHVRLATRLSPRDPQNAFFLTIEGLCHFVEQRYDESAELNRRAIQQKPTHAGALRSLAAACVKLGAMDDARRFVGEALKIQPGLSARWLEANHPLALPEHRLNYIAALRLAGLPE